MKKKILLLVNDEPGIVEGYAQTLYNDFDVMTASSGELALRMLKNQGPFAALITSLQTRGMGEAELLEKARAQVPETFSVLLADSGEMEAALRALNRGLVFRLLMKPFSNESLLAAATAGAAQHEQVRSERERLEKSFTTTIKLLTDVLSAVSPEASARSLRVASIVRHIVRELSPKNGWQWDAAATLSQLGCITMESDLIRKASDREPMSPEQRERFEAHPAEAMHMLQDLPRFEGIAWIIGQQLASAPSQPPPQFDAETASSLVLGAQALRLALACDDLYTNAIAHKAVLERLTLKLFDQELVDALVNYRAERGSLAPRWVSASKLLLGMVLEQDLRSHQGALLIPRGQEITIALRLKIENFAKSAAIDKEILVLSPTY